MNQNISLRTLYVQNNASINLSIDYANMTVSRYNLEVLIVALSLIYSARGFAIMNSSISPNSISQIGETVSLSCKTDATYKYCSWLFESSENDEYCNFELASLVAYKKLDGCSLKNRVQFRGNQSSNECKIVLLKAQISDSGNWTCKMKESTYFVADEDKHFEEKTLHLEIIPSKEENEGINIME